ncbi:TetR family transcriptional regulator [Arcticibacter tournemirensis]|uniref:TetR/AcrR family transcriptional regulator n=1 Tax=Arcticibacter tournemirensis TaxID=699437 RepID=A0A5M9H998_9SPHI|nr:TetR/AcrR family transcriptional regulator [Arcticibacter tournemirensis]KAA8482785.1 TetR/AcrR family transcriptional regulator [Arcticibacter tournemirensis]TQM51086.1 TetR family transcriptional regulator [Arcticibacter tournemirensis]
MARTKDFDEKKVLDKAINLFWLKGYNGTSMQDLVEELGISRSSLYDTYGDKHTLYLKALESYQCGTSGKLCAIIHDSKSAKETIRALLDFITSELLNDKAHKGCFLVNAEVEVAPHDAQVNQMICQNDQQVEDVFYKVISKGQESGEITNKQDARALARFTFNTVKGIRVAAKTTNDKAVFDDIIKLALSILD